MGAPELIFKLRNDGYSIIVDGSYLDISPAENLPDRFVQQLRQNKSEILVELQRETRQQKATAMLEENPKIQRVIHTDTDDDQFNIILTIAVRNVAICEMLMPKDKYDPWQLLTLSEQLGVQNVH